MKAAILTQSKQPLEVAEIDLPETLDFGQVLVKIHFSGICGAQINEIEAVKGPDKFLPHLLGHEGSGVVEKVGNGVTRVKPGDKVVLHWRPSDGIQSETASYLWNGKKVNSGWVTTFNEKASVPLQKKNFRKCCLQKMHSSAMCHKTEDLEITK